MVLICYLAFDKMLKISNINTMFCARSWYLSPCKGSLQISEGTVHQCLLLFQLVQYSLPLALDNQQFIERPVQPMLYSEYRHHTQAAVKAKSTPYVCTNLALPDQFLYLLCCPRSSVAVQLAGDDQLYLADSAVRHIDGSALRKLKADLTTSSYTLSTLSYP